MVLRRVAGWVGFSIAAAVAIACSKGDLDAPVPSLAHVAQATPALPSFSGVTSPGLVPCGTEKACPATKGARRACCNAPGVPPTCKDSAKCGQATKFKYSGMLSCNETADCTGLEPGRDVVCCLTDDGQRADGVSGPLDRASCTPRAACAGDSIVACLSNAECGKGLSCRKVSMGAGVDLGGCLP